MPPPTQLQRTQISRELRSVVWMTIYNSMVVLNDYGRKTISDQWIDILANKHVLRDHRMIDEFNPSFDVQTAQLKYEINDSSFDKFYGLLQWILRDERVPREFPGQVRLALEHCRSPYRVVDDDTLVPIASEELHSALAAGMAAANAHGQPTAAGHLKAAGELLGNGEWADSVRESLHAIEACSRLLAPGSNGLGPALTVLSNRQLLHEAMKKGFLALYGYGSDKGGIRHAMLDAGDPHVTEADALFMLGASASFVSYLLLQSSRSQKAKSAVS